MPKALFLANTDWYLWNFRLPLLRALRDRGWDVVLASPRGAWSERFASEGLRWVPFECARHVMNPIAEAGVLGKLLGLYRREKPDLAHHFTIKCVLYGAMAARASGVPVVISAITGLGTAFVSQGIRARLLRPFIRSLYRVALRGTDVIFQNPDDQQAFDVNGLLKRASVHLIRGSGVDIDLFQPPEQRPSFPPVTIILAARLNREKGVTQFIEAARILRKEGLLTRFIVAGDLDTGHPAAIDETTLASWKRQGDVEFLGHRDDMRDLLQGAHVACLPSWGGEGVPRFLLEAMACGLPVVATDVSGCREAITNADNGFLVARRDPVALADALRMLIKDSELRIRLGIRGRQRAIEEFSQRAVIEQTLAVYDAALLSRSYAEHG